MEILFFIFIFSNKIRVEDGGEEKGGAMSEWLMWSTVNTFFRGSIPLGT
jgi:hypothetical protein